MKKIIIIGGKGTAVVIAEQMIDSVLKFNLDLEVLGFAFDDESFGDEINGLPILSKTKEVYNKFNDRSDVYFVYSLYRSDKIEERIKLRESYGIPNERYINFIHPLATVSRSVEMGVGNIILAGTVLNSNVKLGHFNTFHSGVHVGHDTKIQNSNFFAAQTVIGSELIIGNGNFFGLNSAIKNFVKIGDYNIAGMASNVVKNVNSKKVLIGNPAKVLRINE